tara:strand:- start:3541 stop:3858 length:318 start_codon:yes stop_codon:yes gene_type:complete
MKAIINGLRYDTDKATLIGEASSDESRSDFRYWSAGLYVTPRSKRYFLAGEGGAMTIWSRSLGNDGRTGGDGIIPLDYDGALEWAERNLSADQIEAAFCETIEDA